METLKMMGLLFLLVEEFSVLIAWHHLSYIDWIFLNFGLCVAVFLWYRSNKNLIHQHDNGQQFCFHLLYQYSWWNRISQILWCIYSLNSRDSCCISSKEMDSECQFHHTIDNRFLELVFSFCWLCLRLMSFCKISLSS